VNSQLKRQRSQNNKFSKITLISQQFKQSLYAVCPVNEKTLYQRYFEQRTAPCIEEPISLALLKGHQYQPHQGGCHETANVTHKEKEEKSIQ